MLALPGRGFFYLVCKLYFVARLPTLAARRAGSAGDPNPRLDVVLPTHYHDDHMAGLNLLRDSEGAQTWAAESFADILENPLAYNLPCVLYDPIPVDRRLPPGQPFSEQAEALVTLKKATQERRMGV